MQTPGSCIYIIGIKLLKSLLGPFLDCANPSAYMASPSQIMCSAITAVSSSSSIITMVTKPPEMGTRTVGSCILHWWQRYYVGNATRMVVFPNDTTTVVCHGMGRHYCPRTNSTCHPRGQFGCTTVSRWGPQTACFALHLSSDAYHVVATRQHETLRCTYSHGLCRHIWHQLSMSGMKWTMNYNSALTRLTHCEFSIRYGKTSHKPSWQTWLCLCDGYVLLAYKPEVDTLATDSINSVLSSLALWRHQHRHQHPDIRRVFYTIKVIVSIFCVL